MFSPKTIRVDPLNPDQDWPKLASNLITAGKVIICPTDTVYILATNGLLPNAIAKIFAIKGRNENKPIHVNVRDYDMTQSLVKFNKPGKILFDKFLPGPITIVLPKKSVVPNCLTGGLKTLGIRIPKNPITQKISAICPVPYTTTSANQAGGKNPYSLEDIISQFNKAALNKIDLILDAGSLPSIPPSTVVDLSSGEPIILRKGPISLKQIQEALSESAATP